MSPKPKVEGSNPSAYDRLGTQVVKRAVCKTVIVGSIPIQVSYMWTLAEWLTRLIVDQDFTSSNLVRVICSVKGVTSKEVCIFHGNCG